MLSHSIKGNEHITICPTGYRFLGHKFPHSKCLWVVALSNHFNHKVTVSDNANEQRLAQVMDDRNRANVFGDHQPRDDIDWVTRHTADRIFTHDFPTGRRWFIRP